MHRLCLFAGPALRGQTRVRHLVIATCVLGLAAVPVRAGQSVPRRVEVECQPENRNQGNEVVVSASKRCEDLINAPATMTVLTEDVIGATPSPRIADLMRLVPGVNIAQTSARDVNITLRGATGTLEDSTLVLLDGRSVYQDFFGFVMWDFFPVDPGQIKQIEVIRGPASAVWGANALTGVVNVITRTPREMAGTTASVQFGQFDRRRPGEGFEGGGLFSINATHAEAISDRFAYKVSGGLLAQEPLVRPAGTIAGTATQYPGFANKGTRQGRLDARADSTLANGGTLILAGGITATDGILHSGLGPLDVRSGSTFKYGRLAYERAGFKLHTFVNALDGDGTFLLQRGLDGKLLGARFENQVYDFEVSHARLTGTRHLLSYGGNVRHNRFGLTMAPHARYRNEGGAYVQDTIYLSEGRVRWIVGARVDGFGVLDKAVFSPRTALLVKPRPNQTIRVSFNRAFRAPSLFNSYIDIDFLVEASLPTGTVQVPAAAVGNRDLKEESLTGYEVAYRAQLGPVTAGAAAYVNRTRNMILFTQTASTEFSYRNFNRVTDRGIELSLESRVNDAISTFGNYTWQDAPTTRGFGSLETNVPPRHRVNAGVSYEQGRYFSSVTTSFQSRAFWQDVLDTRYDGWTDAFTVINVGAGVKSSDGAMTVAVRVTNLTNRAIQEHIFGDLIRRTVIGEVRVAVK
jgi:outer membrane receptor protein involved in Fe transport